MEIKIIKNKIIILLFIILIIYILNYIKIKIINQTVEKINNFIEICHKWKLINGIQKSQSIIPKITSIIPSFNSSKTIKRAIRSIQNQKMSDIEILVVDDYSTDNTKNILNELQKEDKRIKIIYNKKNMGTLYSRSIGALNSKGEYIMSLDNDDLFIDENIFNICYEECKKNNIDIVEFVALKTSNDKLSFNQYPEICYYSKFKKHNQVVRKPNLSQFIYKKKNNEIIGLIDATIWGKCIKTDVYQKTIETVGENIYLEYIITNEDRIINFILFRVANSFKFIKKYGILHYKNTSIVNKLWRNYTFDNELFNIEHIYNITKNTREINICVFEILNYESNIMLGKKIAKYKMLVNKVVDNLLMEKYITFKNKQKLIKFKNKFNNN